MKTLLKYFILVSIVLGNGTDLFAQITQLSPLNKRKADSLVAYIKSSKKDTNRVQALLELGNLMAGKSFSTEVGDPLKLINEALNLSIKLKYKIGEMEALCDLGAYEETSNNDYAASLNYYYQAIPIVEKLGNTDLIFEKYGQVLNSCFYLGDYPKAMEAALKGLALAEKINSKIHIAQYYSLLGFIYSNQNNTAKARENFMKYLKMAEEIGNQNMLAHAYTGMTDVYSREGNFKMALEYELKTLALYTKLNTEKLKSDPTYAGYKQNIASTYNNIAGLYQALKEPQKALEYSTKTLELAYDVGVNWYDMVGYHITNGSIYTELKDFAKAETTLNRALWIADSIQHKENIKACYYALSQLFSAKKDFKKAYEFQLKYTDIKDSILNEKSSRQLAEMNTRFETAKKDKELIKKDAEINQQQLEAKQQSTLRNAFIIGFILVCLLALFILRGYRHKQKANIAISKQKEIIEDKNKEITDSIQYAKRIQKALLASDSLLQKNLPEYFILYKPKDIVSGDFYWAHPENNRFLLCVADCTGHGVPGAFMSLLNISFLNEITIEKKITEPHLILNNVRSSIINALNTEGNEESKDGMDCVLCSFDLKNYKLEYAAANNVFYIIRNNVLIPSIADKMPVGKSPKENLSFTNREFDLEKGDAIYIVTDGYADQFGGTKGKKFKYKQLEELILANHQKQMAQQNIILEESITSWRGKLEQVDDILIIGIRI